MTCTWDNQPAIVIWETRNRNKFSLCAGCCQDWALRARRTPETEKVLGYRNLTRLEEVRRRAA